MVWTGQTIPVNRCQIVVVCGSQGLQKRDENQSALSAFFLTQSEIQLIFSHGLDNDRDRNENTAGIALASITIASYCFYVGVVSTCNN
ncbi:hypothetical protein [Nostoc sp. ATCC 53789]|uniref:hypothetical protein n=1 Tax=Nostoc sp. ATCC 53789 TaxID=76335 RepID=UPI001FD75761|nr:hypothetical protein [Nostoc sp. ATCC 53789]